MPQALPATNTGRHREEQKHIHQAQTALVIVELSASYRVVRDFHPTTRQVPSLYVSEH
jgi:hypothetical protein